MNRMTKFIVRAINDQGFVRLVTLYAVSLDDANERACQLPGISHVDGARFLQRKPRLTAGKRVTMSPRASRSPR